MYGILVVPGLVLGYAHAHEGPDQTACDTSYGRAPEGGPDDAARDGRAEARYEQARASCGSLFGRLAARAASIAARIMRIRSWEW